MPKVFLIGQRGSVVKRPAAGDQPYKLSGDGHVTNAGSSPALGCKILVKLWNFLFLHRETTCFPARQNVGKQREMASKSQRACEATCLCLSVMVSALKAVHDGTRGGRRRTLLRLCFRCRHSEVEVILGGKVVIRECTKSWCSKRSAEWLFKKDRIAVG